MIVKRIQLMRLFFEFLKPIRIVHWRHKSYNRKQIPSFHGINLTIHSNVFDNLTFDHHPVCWLC